MSSLKATLHQLIERYCLSIISIELLLSEHKYTYESQLDLWMKLLVWTVYFSFDKVSILVICQSDLVNGNHSRFWLSSFGHLVYLLPKNSILFSIPIFWPWAYLMNVVPETRCAHLIRSIRFYYILNVCTTEQHLEHEIYPCHHNDFTVRSSEHTSMK